MNSFYCQTILRLIEIYHSRGVCVPRLHCSMLQLQQHTAGYLHVRLSGTFHHLALAFVPIVSDGSARHEGTGFFGATSNLVSANHKTLPRISVHEFNAPPPVDFCSE